MYLRDYLNDIPLKNLRTIADNLSIRVEYRARIKLTNAIDKAFWDGDLTGKLIDGLSDRQQIALAIIAFSYKAGVREGVLARKMERLTGMTHQEIMDAVMEMTGFAIVACVDGDEDRIYFCPGGIGDQVRERMFAEVLYEPEDSDERIPAGPPDLIEDLFAFLSRVYRAPVPLTLGGKVKKVVLDRIFEGSPLTAEPQPLAPDFRNEFVVEYLSTRGLIEIGDREITAAPVLGGWLRLSMTERYANAVAFAFSYLLQDPMTIVAVSGIMQEMVSGTGLDVAGFADFLHGRTPAPGGVQRLESRLMNLMRIFFHLGLFHFRAGRYIMTGAGEQFFSGGKIPLDEAVDTRFMMQPNFEIISGPELRPDIRMLLELMSRRKNRDVVTTYVLTPEGVARARERGMGTVGIMEFFERHSRTPLPQNIRFSIESWAEAYGRISFENVTLMRFRDDAACESAIHLPDVAPFVREQLSGTEAVVSTGNVPLITEALKKNGFHPAAFGKSTPDVVLEGTSFQSTGMASLLDGYLLPDVRHTFLFPELPEETEEDGGE